MKDKISNIINHLDIQGSILKSQVHDDFNLDMENLKEDQFKIQLSDHLYRNYYCRNQSQHHNKSYNSLPKEEFILSLKALIGESVIEFSEGWQVMEKDPMGNVHVEKGFFKNIFAAGQYLNHSFSSPIQPGSLVKKATTSITHDHNDYFIYFHGKSPGEYINNFMVRYYFNTDAYGALQIITPLINALNVHQLPFEMKCPADPASFDRIDSIVLYLNKRYVPYFMDILNQLYPSILDHLESGTPLFTRKIFPGIGFGESPPKNSTSFGMSRCDILSQVFYECIQSKQPKTLWLDAVLNHIRQLGFDTDHFYLNPYNHYAYDF